MNEPCAAGSTSLSGQPAWLLEILVCPRCQGAGVIANLDGLLCTRCAEHYPLRGGLIPLVRPEDAPFAALEAESWRIREQACGRYDMPLGELLLQPQEPRTRLLFSWLRRVMHRRGASRILELGAGRGWASRLLAQDGHEVVATDISDDLQIGLGCAVRQREGTGVSFGCVQGRAESLPFRAAAFDCVFCFATVRHIADLERVLQEVSRVLKPGGIFLALDEPFRGKLTTQSQRLQDCVTFRLARTWMAGALPRTASASLGLVRAALGSTLQESARRVPFCISLAQSAGLRAHVVPVEVLQDGSPDLEYLLEEPNAAPVDWLKSFAAVFGLDGFRLEEACSQGSIDFLSEFLNYWTLLGNCDGVFIAEKTENTESVEVVEDAVTICKLRRWDAVLLNCSRDGIVPIYGVYSSEERDGKHFRWVQPSAGFLIANADFLNLAIAGPPAAYRTEPVRVDIRVEDESAPVLSVVLAPGATINVRAPLRGRPLHFPSLLVRLDANAAFLPSDYGGAPCPDMRLLALKVALPPAD